MSSSENYSIQSIDGWETGLEAILNSAVDAIIIIDSDGKIQLVNPAAEKLFQYSSSEILGSNVKILMPEPFKSDHDLYIQNYLETGIRKIIGSGRQVIGRRKDSSTFPMHLSVGEFQVKGRQLFTGIVHDLSEQKMVEKVLHHAQKMEAMGQLTGGIAHDFNNLLTIIIGNLELLEMMLNDDVQKDLLTEAQEAAVLGARLIERLLAFSRKSLLEPVEIDTNELVIGLTDLLHRTLGELVDVSTVLENNLWKINADPAQLESALINLAVNARDAMPSGGKLILETRNSRIDSIYNGIEPNIIPGDYVQISVTDTGLGMSTSVRNQVFDPFYTTKESGRGTGLGLSMVYGFAKQSGGTVTVYSEEGIGTTINIYLPKYEPVQTFEKPNISDSYMTSINGESILVVEDDDRVRRLVLTQLQTFGYKTLEASNAKEAMKIIEKDSAIDLVFTDLIMPGGMSGYEMSKEIRKRYPDIAIVLTSGYAEELVNPENFTKFGLNVLRKPYRQMDLAQTMREVLDSD